MFEDIFAFIRQTFKGVGSFYMVGGATRDFLLGKKTSDIDIATSLTPEQIRSFIPEANYHFAKSGIVSYKYLDLDLTFATMRKEGRYLDMRHPSEITFIDDYIEDSKRRDFTINAIYFDESGTIFDPQGGLNDLKLRLLRMIGDPSVRIKEDPLRMVRAYRFLYKYPQFFLDDDLLKAIEQNLSALEYINPQKIEAELRKTDAATQKLIKDSLKLIL